MTSPLACRGLDVEIAGRVLVRGLELSVMPGEVLCVLGINGSGKTSTLETLCGLRDYANGEILLNGRNIHHLGRRELALGVGLMMQKTEGGFPDRALALAAMGRHPHKRFWEWQDDEDFVCAQRALSDVGLASFAGRSTESLSGGERQRLSLAMLLVQAPRVMLLDEPLSQLDPFHQIEIGRLFARLRDDGHSIVMSVHDINLAARLGDRVLLLFGDGRWTLGSRDEMLRERPLSELYGTRIRCLGQGDEQMFVTDWAHTREQLPKDVAR